MKRLLTTLFFLCLAARLSAGERVTIIIAITNAPLGSTNTLTVNGATRTWTNDVSGSPGTLIQQTNSIPWSATNLLDHLTAYPFTAGHILGQSASNNVRIGGLVDQTMSASQAGNWCSISYSTQTVSSPTFNVRVPITVEAATNQTNIASLLVSALELSTNRFSTNVQALSNFLAIGVPWGGGTQVVYAPKRFWKFGGTNDFLYGGLFVSNTIRSPITSNLINYGNAIRSDGSGANSFQAGSSAVAGGAGAVALGNSSISSSNETLAVGTSATASDQYAVAVGSSALASGGQSVALGVGTIANSADAVAIGFNANALNVDSTALGATTEASGTNSTALGAGAVANELASTAIGFNASAGFPWSTALGYLSQSTESNQVRIGRSVDIISIPGRIEAGSITNAVLRGTNTLNGRVDLTSRANTALANGNNAGVILGTNVYIRLSGATTIATICGFSAAAATDGTWHKIKISGAVTNIIANASGTDPVAANRIITGTGGDIVMTNNPAIIEVMYDLTDARWYLQNFSR